MVYGKASVHDNLDACSLELPRHIGVTDTLLHPDQLGPDLEQLIQQCRYVLRTAKNVDDVDGSGRPQPNADRDAPARPA